MFIKDYKRFIFDTNDQKAADVEPAISIDFTGRIADGIRTLQRVLGVTSITPLSAGMTVKQYKTTVTKNTAAYTEGAEIPVSKAQRPLVKTFEIALVPYRVRTTLQAIKKVGRAHAINEQDAKLLKLIRGDIKADFFAKITGATGITNAGSAATLQAACATVWGRLAQKFEDEDVTPVFFLNPLDVAAYLGTATITTQNAFGVSYLENFLGLGNAIITASVAQGSVFGTVAENLNGACADVNGEGNDLFGFTTDATGLVAMKHSVEDTSLAVNTIAYSAVTFYPELVDGIVKATIGS